MGSSVIFLIEISITDLQLAKQMLKDLESKSINHPKFDLENEDNNYMDGKLEYKRKCFQVSLRSELDEYLGNSKAGLTIGYSLNYYGHMKDIWEPIKILQELYDELKLLFPEIEIEYYCGTFWI